MDKLLRKPNVFKQLKALTKTDFGLELGEVIASGHFGAVFGAKFADGEEVAVKWQHVNDAAKQEFEGLSNVQFLPDWAKRHILSVPNGAFVREGTINVTIKTNARGVIDKKFNVHGFVMSRMKSTISSDNVDLDALPCIAKGILLGLKGIRNMGFAHNDIKPANIMLSADGRAVIGDLGLMNKIGERRGGTPDYMMPGVKIGNERTDLYAFAVMLLKDLMPLHADVNYIRSKTKMMEVCVKMVKDARLDGMSGWTIERAMRELGLADPSVSDVNCVRVPTYSVTRSSDSSAATLSGKRALAWSSLRNNAMAMALKKSTVAGSSADRTVSRLSSNSAVTRSSKNNTRVRSLKNSAMAMLSRNNAMSMWPRKSTVAGSPKNSNVSRLLNNSAVTRSSKNSTGVGSLKNCAIARLPNKTQTKRKKNTSNGPSKKKSPRCISNSFNRIVFNTAHDTNTMQSICNCDASTFYRGPRGGTAFCAGNSIRYCPTINKLR